MKVCLPLDCYIYITSIQLYINNNINNNTIKHDTINNNYYYIFIFIYDAIIWLYNIIHICTWLYVHEDDNRWCNRPNPEKCLSLPVACYNWYWNQPPLEWMRYAQWILSPQTCAAQCHKMCTVARKPRSKSCWLAGGFEICCMFNWTWGASHLVNGLFPTSYMEYSLVRFSDRVIHGWKKGLSPPRMMIPIDLPSCNLT